jgi:hypothetical protein
LKVVGGMNISLMKILVRFLIHLLFLLIFSKKSLRFLRDIQFFALLPRQSTRRLKPNVQGLKDVRSQRIAKGCREGEVLAELDFKAAESSVIAQKLGYEKDGYSIIAQAKGWKVVDVKKIFNPIVYTRSRSTITVTEKHGISALKAFEFLEKVDTLREQRRRPAPRLKSLRKRRFKQ